MIDTLNKCGKRLAVSRIGLRLRQVDFGRRASQMITVALIISFILWRLHGGLALACVMWSLAFVYLGSLPERLKDLTVPWFSVLLGMVCNATVIIANGGFMPVVGLHRGFKPLLPTWIQELPAHHLTFLADQRSLQYCSIGDLFIISGVLLWSIGPRIARLLAPSGETLAEHRKELAARTGRNP